MVRIRWLLQKWLKKPSYSFLYFDTQSKPFSILDKIIDGKMYPDHGDSKFLYSA